MKFRLTTVSSCYSVEEAEILRTLGFEFEVAGGVSLRKLENEVFITFRSLSELADFAEKHGSLIFNEDHITIYDDYVE